jgi:hypothetical protein
MLLMDFHSHLVKNEVIGFLGGHWLPETNRVFFFLVLGEKEGRQRMDERRKEGMGGREGGMAGTDGREGKGREGLGWEGWEGGGMATPLARANM